MTEINPLTEMIRPHVKKIEEDAAKGNKSAQEVIAYYEMHRKCPGDPGAAVFCEVAFAAWRGGGE